MWRVAGGSDAGYVWGDFFAELGSVVSDHWGFLARPSQWINAGAEPAEEIQLVEFLSIHDSLILHGRKQGGR